MKSFRAIFKQAAMAAYLLSILVFSACSDLPENATKTPSLPKIFPDYIDVTIPAGIAPMNFNYDGGEIECMDVLASGKKGGEIRANGEWADFDIDEWHALTEQNKGSDITFTVSIKQGGAWTTFKPFVMHVSRYSLEDYGLTYRRIPPGYEVGGMLGMYQRDIHTFKESAMLLETAVPGQCMNCHVANHCDPNQFFLHVRGSHSGTLLQQNGKRTWLETKTDSTIGATAHGYWHPDGRYIAYSLSPVAQVFYVGKERLIEPFDKASNLLVLDTQTQELIRTPLLETEDFETFPAFSTDGKTIFFATAGYQNVPGDVQKIKYSLCSIGFNADTGTFANHVDTLINARETDHSISFPRPSYDGRFIMYSQTDWGMFPVDHPEGDLWLLDLKTGKCRALEEVNSNEAESFHNWSSNSRWFVFTSRRHDGIYTQLFLSSMDEKGHATKPFLLPQRNPRKYYEQMYDAYNTPDFTRQRVELDARAARSEVFSGERTQVRLKQ